MSVRVRLGQAEFRRRMLEEFETDCAFTGRAPLSMLEACHLYSYAAVGEHHDHGGLILRRDVHRLFDLGQVAVNPETMTIDVSDELRGFPTYASLAGRKLGVLETTPRPTLARRTLARTPSCLTLHVADVTTESSRGEQYRNFGEAGDAACR